MTRPGEGRTREKAERFFKKLTGREAGPAGVHFWAAITEWNRLVLEQDLSDKDKLRHFTIGTPCFAEYADCDGAQEWHDVYKRTIAPITG